MDDLELVKMHLSRIPISGLYRLAKDTGVGYSALWHYKRKQTKTFRYPTIKKLAEHFRAKHPAIAHKSRKGEK